VTGTVSRRLLIGALALGATGLGATPARGAVTIGETFVPTTTCAGASSTVINFQSAPPPAAQYESPTAGVITSWTFQSGATVPTAMRLTLVRAAPGVNTFTSVGRSAFEVPVVNQSNTYATRVPVLAGDILGYYFLGAHHCTATLAGSVIGFFNGPETTIGATQTYSGSGAFRLSISAQL
jgi:hypothetical protein